jgi:hypothetical protein
MRIIDTILQLPVFTDHPPVLVDIGASGEINAKWKQIAKYSICVAFDADDREFQISEAVNKTYKKLISFNRIVIATENSKADFYLTKSPFCSSLLEPDLEKLSPWLFRPLFEITEVTSLPAITLGQALREAGIANIDWFKSDTQGTDLRLFISLPSTIKENVLAAEFEPGIMDAYKGEDKLYMIMREFQQWGYWLSSMKVKGTQRLHERYAEQIGSFASQRIIKTAPGWAEISYLKQNTTGIRNILLLFVFALLEKQYGFALEIVDDALQQYHEPIFQECKKSVLNKIATEKNKLPLVIMKRKFNKLFNKIND